MFGRPSRKVQSLVKDYDEGRRLMRQGDGADEWYGMKFTKDALLALIALGCDETGRKVPKDRQVAILRQHGLHKEAEALT